MMDLEFHCCQGGQGRLLEAIGVDAWTEAVYRAMLTHADWTAQEIAAHLSSTDEEVEAALAELADLSLLTRSEVSPMPFRLVDPALGLATLVSRAEADIQAQRQYIESVRLAMVALSTEVAERASREGFVRLTGLDAVRRHMERLATQIRHECLSMNPVSAQSPDAKAASRPLNEMLFERGAKVRCIYQESFTNYPNLVKYAGWLTSKGGEVRTVPIVPSIMVVYDRQGVIVPIDPADAGAGAIEVTAPGLVNLAITLFEQLWHAALPFGQSVARDDEGLSPTERHLLELLCAGHTDEMVARRLGVSLSTVRRQMAGLMTRLSARSRFQAGVRAAERGWLRSMGAGSASARASAAST
jgi:DNA-binding CsgD family transcriptional regulator